MTRALLRHLSSETSKLQQAGLFRAEVPAAEANQDADAIVFTNGDVLGLRRRPEIVDAAVEALRAEGYGPSSARSFGGTLALHHALERKLADFIGLPDALVYSNGYATNVGLFDVLFDARDYVLVDAAIHPSVAEGIRLSGARALPYRSEDLEHLEDRLRRSRTARFRLIATDGVFPLSGNVARLDEVCGLARRYDALVMVYDALGVGVLGSEQRGTAELHGVASRIDIVTGGFGDVLGGGFGGYAAGRSEVVSWLRQKSTPYLFAGPLTPADAGAATAALDLVTKKAALVGDVLARTQRLKETLTEKGFEVDGGGHAILTVGVGNAVTLQRLVDALSEQRVFVQGMCYPVVPENSARIQLKMTTAHTEAVLEAAVERLVQAAHTLQLL